MTSIYCYCTRAIDKNARWSDFLNINNDERVIVFCVTFTFVFYVVGALYLVAPIVGWALLVSLLVRWSVAKPFAQQNSSWLIKLWILAAIILEIALILGHLDFNLGFGKIIKSTIGWAKGWALLAIFIVLGFSLKIRYQIMCRAACVVGLVAIVITPFLILAYLMGLPEQLYVSPLKILGGAGAEFFTVILYEICLLYTSDAADE